MAHAPRTLFGFSLELDELELEPRGFDICRPPRLLMDDVDRQ